MATSSGQLFYFCFGSNLWSKRMHINVKSAVKYGNGLLKDWEFTFDGSSKLWKGSTANIVPQKDQNVWGTVWTISETELNDLDKQEVGYRRIEIPVLVNNDKTINCYTYIQKGISSNDFVSGTGLKTPSLSYKTVILNGAYEQNLPTDYIQFLKSFKDNGVLDCGPPDLQLKPYTE